MTRSPHLLGGLIVVALWGAAVAEVEIELVDGKRISAVSLERRGEVFVLDFEDGGRTTLPVGVVGGIRFDSGEPSGSRATKARVQIALSDGRVLQGVAVERRDGLYLLTLDAGETITLPEQLVRGVKLTVKGPRDEDGPEQDDEAVDEDSGDELDDEPPAPEDDASTKRSARDDALVDRRAAVALQLPRLPPSTARQLAAFGDRSSPAAPPVAAWTPADEYGRENDTTQFRPSDLSAGSYDPRWTPAEGGEPPSRLPDFNSSSWYRPGFDPKWRPRDAWNRTDWFSNRE